MNSTSVRTFLDTNVLVYMVDDADQVKKKTAQTLFAKDVEYVVSAQVLNEFYWTVTRKLKVPLDTETAAQMVRDLAQQPCVAVDQELVKRALVAGRRWQLSHWDALVVEAARISGAPVILSEDLHDGANFDGVVIENPFNAVN